MEAIAKARPEAVGVKQYQPDDALPSIVVSDKKDQTPNDFLFPGENVPGERIAGSQVKSAIRSVQVNRLEVEGRQYQAIVGAMLILAGDCFESDTFFLGASGDWTNDWAAARSLYTEVTHRKAPEQIGMMGAYGDYDDETTQSQLLGQLMGFAPFLLMGLLWWVSRTRSTGMSWGSYYLAWLAAPLLIAWLARFPWLLLAVPVVFFGRKWLPDPYLLLRRSGRMRRLRITIASNPHDVKSAVDLAELYLEQRRPQRALPLLDRALERDPQSAELIHYKGLCLLGLARYSEAQLAFARAAELQPKLRYGEPLLRAADSYVAMKNDKEALPLLERFVQVNHSSIEGLYKLSRVRKRMGDADGASKARGEARSLYRELPSFARKKQFGWLVRAWLA